jgi:hypothetical protein
MSGFFCLCTLPGSVEEGGELDVPRGVGRLSPLPQFFHPSMGCFPGGMNNVLNTPGTEIA